MMAASSSRDALRLPLALAADLVPQSQPQPHQVNGNGSVVTAAARTPTNSAAGAPTLTTPTLTPTTLRNIEQMFLESEAFQEVRPPDPHENAARFEPPAISINGDDVVGGGGAAANGQPPPPPPPVVKVKQEWGAVDGSVLPGPHSNEKHLVIPAAPPSSSTAADLSGASALPGPNGVRPSTIPVPVVLPTIPAALPTVPVSSLPSSSLPPPPPPPPTIELPSAPLPLVSAAAAASAAPPIELPTVPLRLLPTEPVMPVVSSPNNNNNVPPPSTSTNGIPSSSDTPPPPPSKKSKRSNPNDVNLTPEELERKLLRRQRNKEAAARCRKRRLDQTMTLQDEVDMWESKSAGLREEIRALERRKGELQALLKGHPCVAEKAAKVKKEEAS